MRKTELNENGEIQKSLFKVKTYSISEITAAGGATAFANQIGKKPQHIAARLKGFSKEDFLTDDEAIFALENLQLNK